MQSLAQLTQAFAIEAKAAFEQDAGGMIRLQLAARDSEATIYLQGAHVTHWAPRGAAAVLYLSPEAVFAPGKAIRGGVPVLFPWFGPRWDGQAFDASNATTSPAHGFARTTAWTVEAVREEADGALVAVFSLEADARSRSLGYEDFRLGLECRVGRELDVALHVSNRGASAMEYEEGLHAYFAVADIEPARLLGLRGSTYLDMRDGAQRKTQFESDFAFTRDVDRTHLHTAAPLVLKDPAGARALHVVKRGSQTTVVWNPWTVLTPGFADLPEDSWRHFACVETVNAGENRQRLDPGATHTLGMTVRVEAL